MLFFSIVTASYNRELLISQTIDSILNQTYVNFELLIVDDGSTDNTEGVVGTYILKDKRVQYFKKNNAERGAARNYGVSKASGDYVVFIDSDDLMKTTYLADLADIILEVKPTPTFLALKFNFVNDEGNEIAYKNPLESGFNGIQTFLKGNSLACNFCVKTKDALAMPFLEPRKYATIEDWVFVLCQLFPDKKVYISEKIGVSMREHDGRSMSNNLQVIKAREEAVEWLKSNLKFEKKQLKQLIGWSHCYCAIHYYLDNKRRHALNEIFQSIKQIGLNIKSLVLFVKVVLGRKIILFIKNRH